MKYFFLKKKRYALPVSISQWEKEILPELGRTDQVRS
jgi:hypothetical protein